MNKKNYIYVFIALIVSIGVYAAGEPTIVMTNPLANVILSTTSNYVILTATDTDGISSCQASYDNGTTYSNLLSLGAGVYSSLPTPVPATEGVYHLRVKCNDSLGNVNDSLNHYYVMNAVQPDESVETYEIRMALTNGVAILDPPNDWAAYDFSIFYNSSEDLFYSYYIRNNPGENWNDGGNNSDCFPLETSKDLFNWTYVKYGALCRSNGSVNFDAFHIWAPHVIKNATGDNYFMYYAGVTNWTVGGGKTNTQSIGLATSDDLVTWTKYPVNNCANPGDGCVWDCNTTWTTTNLGYDWDGDCRDPFVFYEDGMYYMLTTMKGYVGWVVNNTAIVGIANSTDGINWDDLYGINKTWSVSSASLSKAESATLWRQGDYYIIHFVGDGSTMFSIYSTNFTNQSGWSDPVTQGLGGYASEFLNVTSYKGYNVVGSLSATRLAFRNFTISSSSPNRTIASGFQGANLTSYFYNITNNTYVVDSLYTSNTGNIYITSANNTLIYLANYSAPHTNITANDGLLTAPYAGTGTTTYIIGYYNASEFGERARQPIFYHNSSNYTYKAIYSALVEDVFVPIEINTTNCSISNVTLNSVVYDDVSCTDNATYITGITLSRGMNELTVNYIAPASETGGEEGGGGSIDPSCTQGDLKCSAGNLVKCSGDQWYFYKTCVYGCEGAECLPFSAELDNVPAREQVSLDLSDSQNLEEIWIILNSDFNSASFTVEEFKTLLSVSKLNAIIMSYFDVNSNIDNDLFESVGFKFSVSKNWVLANDIDINTIKLYHYDGSEWIGLETTLLSEDDYEYLFTARTDSFSYFAIAGDKNVKPKIDPGLRYPTNPGDSLVADTGGGLFFLVPYILVFAALVIISAVLIYYFKTYHGRRRRRR